jgi:hypothetical protein
MVLVSSRAGRELKKMGCGGPNFLRVSKSRGHKERFSFFVDSIMGASDEVIHDGDVRIVTDLPNIPFTRDLSIDSDSLGLKVS